MSEPKKMAKVESNSHKEVKNIQIQLPYKYTDFSEFTAKVIGRAEPIDFLKRETEGLQKKKSKIEKELNSGKLDDDKRNKLQKDLSKIEADLKRKKSATQRAIIVIIIEELKKHTSISDTNFLCANNGKIYLYINTHWNLVDIEAFRSLLKKVAIKLGASKYMAKHFKFIDELESQFKSELSRNFQTKKSNSVLINFKNGTYDFKNNRLRPHSPDDNFTYVLDYDFNPDKKAALWQKFLDEVIPDKEKQMILAEFIASAFVKNDVLKLEKMLILFGVGSNGKSVVFEVITELLGTENISNHNLEALSDKKGYSLAGIENKLLNYSSELSNKINADRVKQLASGEPVEARLPYEQPFFVKNYAKFMFNTNVLPKDVEHTHGFFRRFMIIHFDQIISKDKQDKELPNRIVKSELDGVFNWVLDGLNRLLKNKGFSKCESSEKLVNQYKLTSDSVGEYLNEHNAEKSIKSSVKLKFLFAEYRRYCIESGYRYVNKSNFEQRVEHHGYSIGKVRKVKSVFISIDYV